METFAYKKAGSLQQALDLLSTNGSQVLAGGSDLLSLLKNNILTPESLVDVKGISDLAYIRESSGLLYIGATTTLTTLSADEVIKDHFPIIAQALPLIATPQIRNQATVAGNLCQRPRCWYFRSELYPCFRKNGSTCFAIVGRNSEHAVLGGAGCFAVHPSDLAAVFVALNAQVVISWKKGTRVVPMEQFFALPSVNPHAENILAAGEMVTEVQVPMPAAGTKGVFLKNRLRGTWDFAATSVAMVAQAQGGALQNVRVVLGGVAAVPWRAKEAESALAGKTVTPDSAAAAAKAALRYTRPMAENGYKIKQAQALIQRAALALIGS